MGFAGHFPGITKLVHFHACPFRSAVDHFVEVTKMVGAWGHFGPLEQST
jgi:hypothetical protein